MSWETSRKLRITENEFSNLVGTIVLNSLSIVVIVLKIFQEFRNNLPAENLKKVASVALIKSPFYVPVYIFALKY